MGHVVLQPVSNHLAKQNYFKTIENPVGIDTLTEVLSEDFSEKIHRIYPEGKAYIWGVQNGKQDSNYKNGAVLRKEILSFFQRIKG